MKRDFEIGIVGAGLAGLSLAIQLSRVGRSVALFEKSSFPYHKLCGEYLSRESLPFLASLGVDYAAMKPAEIDRLEVTNESGKSFVSDLPLGGIGLSRYQLDFEMYHIAKRWGTTVMENTPVTDFHREGSGYKILTKKGEFTCNLLISSFGKKSNLKNKNILSDTSKNSYIGIKYHVKYHKQPEELVSLHNFKDGYCGVCRLEKDWVSVCYLSHTDNLVGSGRQIADMEKNILYRNKRIADLFEGSEFLYKRPIAVSNIDFRKKKLIDDGIYYVGDAAGLITPLCGNGMSMALHASYILGELLIQYFEEKIDLAEANRSYVRQWEQAFKLRMKVGRIIQNVFRYERSSDLALSALKLFPLLSKPMISMTHGKPFFKAERVSVV